MDGTAGVEPASAGSKPAVLPLDDTPVWPSLRDSNPCLLSEKQRSLVTRRRDAGGEYRFCPDVYCLQSNRPTIERIPLVRNRGLEPRAPAWKAGVLPLTPVSLWSHLSGFAPTTPSYKEGMILHSPK